MKPKPKFAKWLPKNGRPKTHIDRFVTLMWLKEHGFRVPPFGMVKGLCQEHDVLDPCVVWLHGGSQLLKLADAVQLWPESYGVMYVGGGQVAVSTKVVHVGSSKYWVEYSSTDWRSNRGEFTSEVIRIEYGEYHPLIELPLFSVDYVPSGDGDHSVYAIDFDIDPGIRGTGIENLLTPKRAAKLIRDADKRLEKTCTN